jgi:hypothetical protein
MKEAVTVYSRLCVCVCVCALPLVTLFHVW